MVKSLDDRRVSREEEGVLEMEWEPIVSTQISQFITPIYSNCSRIDQRIKFDKDKATDKTAVIV